VIALSKDPELLACCGQFCGFCVSYLGEAPPPCPSCASAKGRPWWGECKVYVCVASRGIEYCGLCRKFPCDTLVGHCDPNNPQGQRNAVVRVGALAYRAKYGDEKTLVLWNKLGRPRRSGEHEEKKEVTFPSSEDVYF